jgi:hypothetical protein
MITVPEQMLYSATAMLFGAAVAMALVYGLRWLAERRRQQQRTRWRP